MLLKLYEKNNNPADLQQVVDLLNDGGILIYPTDTMYAIGCHGLKERAIERICRLKNIDPKKNNLSIICYDLSKVSEYAKVDNSTFKLMKRNLPGAFTFILNGTTRLPARFAATQNTALVCAAAAVATIAIQSNNVSASADLCPILSCT